MQNSKTYASKEVQDAFFKLPKEDREALEIIHVIRAYVIEDIMDNETGTIINTSVEPIFKEERITYQNASKIFGRKYGELMSLRIIELKWINKIHRLGSIYQYFKNLDIITIKDLLDFKISGEKINLWNAIGVWNKPVIAFKKILVQNWFSDLVDFLDL